MFRFLTALLFVAGSVFPGRALTLDPMTGTRDAFGELDIEFRFFQTPSAEVAQSFADAEAFWESQIIGYSSQELADDAKAAARSFALFNPGPPIQGEPTALIDVDIVFVDGPNGRISAAGPSRISRIFNDDGSTAAAVGAVGKIELDSTDIPALAFRNSFTPLVTRQIGLVLGFATLFPTAGLIDDSGPSPVYTGPFAVSTYNREFNNSDTGIPLDPVQPFWDESGFGDFGSTGNPELFTRILNTGSFISDTSIAAFDDLGFVTRLNHSAAPLSAVPLPPSALLLLGGLGVLVLSKRRRRAAAESGDRGGPHMPVAEALSKQCDCPNRQNTGPRLQHP